MKHMSMKTGGGGRFLKMVQDLMAKGMSMSRAKGIAAAAGRKKFGKSKFQKMAAKGKKRAAKKK